MAAKLQSYLGSVYLLANNPRTIRENAFNRLVESIERDPEFLMARGVVVWQVPDILALSEGEKNPFVGQEGKLVVLGGNQRCRAFMALGKKELQKKWIVEAKDDNGVWWSVEKAERFVQIDNNPEGISGETDIKMMFENFSKQSMEMTGIDFSEYEALMETKAGEMSPEDKAETGDHGEKSPALQEFIEHREKKRKDLSELDETGFYQVLVFPDVDTKIEFISKSGLTGDKGAVKVDMDVYVVLVFESYAQKMDFLKKTGMLEEPKDGDPAIVYDRFCDGVAFAKKIGVELKESMLHFGDPRFDQQLAAMALDEDPQKSEEEQMEELLEERKRAAAEGGNEASEDGEQDGEDVEEAEANEEAASPVVGRGKTQSRAKQKDGRRKKGTGAGVGEGDDYIE